MIPEILQLLQCLTAEHIELHEWRRSAETHFRDGDALDIGELLKLCIQNECCKMCGAPCNDCHASCTDNIHCHLHMVPFCCRPLQTKASMDRDQQD